jgi:hypothetical protein
MNNGVNHRTDPAGDVTMGEQDRVERFKNEIADMGLRDPATNRERMLLRLGAVLLVAGPVVTLGAYIQDTSSSGANAALQQGDDQIIALIGVAVAILGLGLFVRYSIAHFLRFWLARLSYEQQAQTDRLIEALGHDAVLTPGATVAGPAPRSATTPAPASPPPAPAASTAASSPRAT